MESIKAPTVHPIRHALTLVSVMFLLTFVGTARTAAQQANDDGWIEAVDDGHSVFWSFKIEPNDIALKWERNFQRHYGDRAVFSDLILTYGYSIGPASSTRHAWITRKITIKHWNQNELTEGLPKETVHTEIVKILVPGGTSEIGKTRKFCWKLIDARLSNGKKVWVGDESHKTCTPLEKGDWAAPPGESLLTIDRRNGIIPVQRRT